MYSTNQYWAEQLQQIGDGIMGYIYLFAAIWVVMKFFKWREKRKYPKDDQLTSVKRPSDGDNY